MEIQKLINDISNNPRVENISIHSEKVGDCETVDIEINLNINKAEFKNVFPGDIKADEHNIAEIAERIGEKLKESIQNIKK